MRLDDVTKLVTALVSAIIALNTTSFKPSDQLKSVMKFPVTGVFVAYTASYKAVHDVKLALWATAGIASLYVVYSDKVDMFLKHT